MIRRPCAWPGCRALTAMGVSHCPIHAPKAAQADAARKARFDEQRAVVAWRGWYKLAAWRKRAAAQMAAEPLCAMCAGRGMVKAAKVADHVIPHRGDAALFWQGRLQSLCWTCHSGDKQRAERAAGGVV